MGRPNKPTKLLMLQGTYDATRHDKRNEPESGAVGDPPDWLGDIAKTEWRRLASGEVYGQVLMASDSGALQHYCILYERMVLDATGARPMTASERQTYHSICVQLGLTPAARTRVSPVTAKKKESEWDKIATAI